MNSEITETVLYLIFLLLPGYVTLWVIIHNSLSSDENITNSRYVLWSVVDITLLSPFYAFVRNCFDTNNLAYWLSTFLVSVTGGLLIGKLISSLKNRGWFESLYKVNGPPTAWDKIFYNMDGEMMILIETSDDRKIASNWNEKSIASKGGRDIYLSNYYLLKKCYSKEKIVNEWTFINKGMWVNGNDIRRVIFSRGDLNGEQ